MELWEEEVDKSLQLHLVSILDIEGKLDGKLAFFSHHSEAGEGPPAGLELAGPAHSVALALNLHVPFEQLKKR